MAGGNKVAYPWRKKLLSVFTEWVRVIDANHFTIDNQSLTPRRLTKKFSSQPAFTCSKLTKKTLEQDVKYVQSQQ